jgi:DNA-binding MarR family transcriptional regulator
MTVLDAIDDNPDAGRTGIAELKGQLNALAWKMVRVESTWYARLGMTRVQAVTLQAIQEFGPDIDMATLATLTTLPPSTITSIVDRLVGLGFVTRQRDDRDRRRVTATITDPGRDKVADLEAHSARLLAAMLDGIPDADVATVTRVFRHMTARLDHLDLEHGGATPPGAS